eukprot:TRINITY_DN3864_c0_g3_i13.p1 TRINITY_DN3864_c0_g3~~TRINITY_DN3864_c0_g3_i13.p1  ORF type:complete len:323 (+),score=49.22 TRINITY_DN3864_c0_g3_i13:722-1690(+)
MIICDLCHHLTLDSNTHTHSFKTAFPYHTWIEGRFQYPRHKISKQPENILHFFEFVKLELRILKMEDWYLVSRRKFCSLGGSHIISKFGNLPSALSFVYPEFHWVAEKFYVTRRGTWDDPEKVTKVVKYAEEILGIFEISDWYGISREEFIQACAGHSRGYDYKITNGCVDNVSERDETGVKCRRYGRSLLAKMGGIYQLLKKVYPDYPWILGKFRYVLRNSWNEIFVVREFLEYVCSVLGISGDDEWCRVSNRQVVALGGGGLLMKFGGIFKALKFGFPEKKWDEKSFLMTGKSSNQRWLRHILKEIFPGTNMEELVARSR